ncbi:response regulator [Paenibacillus sp. F411]|uniref:helix-turn-helix domain-containing protein n=1 Tax=Paenibacillus sp. F411 TaxID=2820239 RepID=UPI001AAE62B8|nr:helix-turn-helix domain-containing protein [Paenibacillus sp. F411]MBO2944381.1 response regulator [Paenibacillus sp. F411]
MHKIVIAEDEKWIRKGIVEMVRNIHGPFAVVAEAANGKEAMEAYQQWYPSIVITDILMPETDGLWLLKELHAAQYPVIPIVLSGFDNFQYAQQGIAYGVSSYLLKPVGEDDLRDALQRAADQLHRLHNMYPLTSELRQLQEQMLRLDPQEASKVYKRFVKMVLSLKHHHLSEFHRMVQLLASVMQPGELEVQFTLPATTEIGPLQHYFDMLLEAWLRRQAKDREREQDETTTSNYMMKKVCEHIQTHYMDDLPIGDMAKLANLSLSHFSLLMKKQTGYSYTNYVNYVRIQKAKELLLEPDLKIHEVGEMVGYTSMSYFFKVFKTFAGQSPSEYRKSIGL